MIEAARAHRPDVILTDRRMPHIDGLEATSRIIAEADWNVPVLILTTLRPRRVCLPPVARRCQRPRGQGHLAQGDRQHRAMRRSLALLDARISVRYPRAVGKVLISVPDDLLERIDREASARGTTRSRFLEEAARRELGWPAPDQVETALTRARKALAPYGSFESADLIRRDRDAHDAADRRRL